MIRDPQQNHLLRTLAFIATILFLVTACSQHRPWFDDFHERKVTVGGKEWAYRVFIPKNLDLSAKTPVMLYLHGSGSSGEDNFGQADAFNSTTEGIRDDIKFIAVLPQCPAGSFWSHKEVADYAMAALASSMTEFNGDPERVYLAGFSLGGYGVWHIAAANPGKFAALVPVAGGVVGERPIEPRHRAEIIPQVGEMLDSAEPYKAVANAIGQTPAWVFHGAKDDAVPVEFSRRIVQALGEAGNRNVKYTELPDDGHIIIGKAFQDWGLLDWLTKQRLEAGSK